VTRAIIIGAGPGGLAAAIALRQTGLEVAVFERAEELEPVGAGVALYHNAMRVLGALGLGDAVAAAGVPIERAEIRTAGSEVLARGDLGALTRKLGVPAICLHRADLQTTLLDTLGPEVVHCGYAASSFAQDGMGVTARFADGREERGDVLIGADGLHSVVRDQILGGEPPRYAGYTAWRSVAPIEPVGVPPRCGFESWGRGARFGLFRVSGGRTYWFGVANAPEGARDPPAGRKRDLLARFGDWHEPIASLIAATEEAAILRHDIYDRPPARRWGQGWVTLLGDAAHPMTPNLAQGAGQAIEDAASLARWLAQESDPAIALRGYEQERQARTAPLVIQSRRMGWMGQLAHPLACTIRDRLVKLTPPSVMEHQLEAIVSAGR
jgi:2-polyprenyl-6-methoxyphenol hydroxylase-like FAD-dependent oxidoreductase